MKLTWLDSNSWLLELGSKRILVDPWLVESLVFADLKWLFEGTRRHDRPIPENIDFILLSQGLDDHAHRPTLKRLDRNLPVIGSKNAATVVAKLGYNTIVSLSPGDTYTFEDAIEIYATPGDRVGITNVENGYVIKSLETGERLYYEPHGSHDESVRQFAPVDVAIAPIVNLSVPLAGAVIKGKNSAPKLAEWLQPQYFVATAAGGDIDYKGLLANLLSEEGGVGDLQETLQHKGLATQVMKATPGEPFELNCDRRSAPATAS